MIMIYALQCQTNGKAYIGSTKGKIAKRLREHRCLLRAGVHKTKALQEDWQQYGEARFHITVMERLPDLDLEKRRTAELTWMEQYAKHGLLYNEHMISMQPLEEARKRGVANAHLQPGNRWTPEANEKRRLAQLGKPKNHGAKISATKRARRVMR